jgi:hypothetical protein
MVMEINQPVVIFEMESAMLSICNFQASIVRGILGIRQIGMNFTWCVPSNI